MMELLKSKLKPNPNQASQVKIQQIQQRQMTKASEFARMVYEKQTASPLKYKTK